MTLKFELRALEETLTDYATEVDHQRQRLARLERSIDEAAEKVPVAMRAVIDALQSLRGVSKLTATTLVAPSDVPAAGALGSLERVRLGEHSHHMLRDSQRHDFHARNVLQVIAVHQDTSCVARIAVRSRMSPEEFLACERNQTDKHEYYDGEVFAMAGGSPRHNELSGNVLAMLKGLLRPRGCSVLNSDQRVTFREGRKRYVYPDVSVTCGTLELQSEDVLLNPQILVEVLSASTEQYDRGLKWVGYQRIPSLTDYVLVAETDARIEHYRRAGDGDWTYRVALAGERVTLSNGATLDVDEIFAGVFALPGDAPLGT